LKAVKSDQKVEEMRRLKGESKDLEQLISRLSQLELAKKAQE